jgi:DHA2 family methylenomycin A resistance protein-like MFS transporter
MRDTSRVGMIALCLPYFAIILDAGVLNLAIPTIRRDLQASVLTTQWTLSGYTLTLAALLLSAGAAGDRFGHRRMLCIGVTVFGLASIACSAAPTAGALVAARLVQGAGAAALLPATLALVPRLFPPGRARQRAMLIWVGTGSLAVAGAPLVGGALIAAFGWRSIFVVNIPIAGATLLLARAGLPSGSQAQARLNPVAQILGALIMAALATAAIATGPFGWTSPVVLVPVVGAAVAGVVLAILRRGREIEIGRSVRTAVASAGVMGFVFYGVLYFLSLHFQQQRGWSPLRAGVALLPLTVASMIGPLIYGRLTSRWKPSIVLLGGFASVLLGTVDLVVADSFVAELIAMLLVGGASTVCFSALTSILVNGAPLTRVGALSGWQNTSRQAGAMLATALVGSLLIGAPSSHEMPAAAVLMAVAACGVTIALNEARS